MFTCVVILLSVAMANGDTGREFIQSTIVDIVSSVLPLISIVRLDIAIYDPLKVVDRSTVITISNSEYYVDVVRKILLVRNVPLETTIKSLNTFNQFIPAPIKDHFYVRSNIVFIK